MCGSVEHEGKVYRLTGSVKDAGQTGPVSALPEGLQAECPSQSMLEEVERLNRISLTPQPEEEEQQAPSMDSLYDYSVFGGDSGSGAETAAKASQSQKGGEKGKKKTKAQRTQVGYSRICQLTGFLLIAHADL